MGYKKMKAETKKIPKLVLIEWIDSRSPIPGWCLIEECEMPHACKCVSVGYLVVNSKDEKVLAQSIADLESDSLQANGLMVIPAKTIITMRPLVSRN